MSNLQIVTIACLCFIVNTGLHAMMSRYKNTHFKEVIQTAGKGIFTLKDSRQNFYKCRFKLKKEYHIDKNSNHRVCIIWRQKKKKRLTTATVYYMSLCH